MSKAAESELNWWEETDFEKIGMPMQQLRIVPAKIKSYTDASSNHWGFLSSHGKSADGGYPPDLINAPIIVKEAFACYKGLSTFKKACEVYLYRGV